jgi:8-oxo-dGTP diphosphatase
VRVVAAVILDGSRVLACRRAPHKSLAGKWEFPGGKVDAHETPEAALMRELHEELDVDSIDHERFRTDVSRIEEGTIQLECYRVSLPGGAPSRSTDHDELRWVELRDIRALDWATPDLEMVRQLHSSATS